MTAGDDDSWLVSITDADIGYGRSAVVKGISLSVHPGDYWVLLGPNGRGKTTLVQTLLGNLQPLRGEIRYSARCDRRRKVGFVPQGSQQHVSLPTTVHEFVSLGTVNLGLRGAARRERIAEALQQVDLAERAQQDFWHLSGGQRQRALIARAMVRQPLLLILDEPTTGLDIGAEQALLACVARLNREGLGVIFVTHDLVIAERHATHAALFHRGVVESGKAAELLTASRLAAAFDVAPSLLEHRP